MFYDQKKYKFYKPLTERENRQKLKDLMLEVVIFILTVFGIVLLLTGAFWLDSCNSDIIKAGALFPLLPQPDLSPEGESEFECRECDRISDSEFCSKECHDAHFELWE